MVLVRHASDDYVLLLNQHHIVTDGWSAGVLVEELTERYAAGRGAAVELPALPIQYPDFAVWQRARLSGPALVRLLEKGPYDEQVHLGLVTGPAQGWALRPGTPSSPDLRPPDGRDRHPCQR